MTATSWKVAKQGPGGSYDEKGMRSYSIPLEVQTDDQADGPQIVLDYMIGQGFSLGSGYKIANDEDLNARCTGLSCPSRKSNAAKTWTLTASYKYIEEEEGQTPGGGISEDPTEWLWKHQMAGVAWQEPCYQATNLTAFPHPLAGAALGTPYTRAANVLGPVVNSAGIVLDPTLMRDEHDSVWRVTCYSILFDWALRNLQGKVNETSCGVHPFLQDVYGIMPFRFPRYYLKCNESSAEHRTKVIDGTLMGYWEWHFEFAYRQGGWYEQILDMGITARAAAGDPDGLGGQMAALKSGAAPVMPLLDGRGRRVPERVLLDGAGSAMTAGAAWEDEGFYFSWLKDQLAEFHYDPNYGTGGGIPFKFFET